MGNLSTLGAGVGTAVAPGIGTAIGGIAGGLGEVLGGLFGGGDDEQKKAAAAIARLQQIYGNLTPATAEALMRAGQAGNAAGVDPAGQQAMADALAHLQGVYQSGGMTEADRLAQEQATQAANQNEASQRGAIMQEMASRGQAGGGAELAARLASQQQTANAAHMAGSSSAQAAQARALAAMAESGQLGGQMTAAAQRAAAARDAMAQFNASQRLGAQGMAWDQQMQKAQGLAGGAAAEAGYYGGEAQRQREKAAGIGRAAGQTVGAGIAGWSMLPGKEKPAEYPGGANENTQGYYVADPTQMPRAKYPWEG
jgi:hypothetical protein